MAVAGSTVAGLTTAVLPLASYSAGMLVILQTQTLLDGTLLQVMAPILSVRCAASKVNTCWLSCE